MSAAVATGKGLIDHVIDQRALAGTGDAGHAGEPTKRNINVEILEVVGVGAANFEVRLILRNFPAFILAR